MRDERCIMYVHEPEAIMLLTRLTRNSASFSGRDKWLRLGSFLEHARRMAEKCMCLLHVICAGREHREQTAEGRV